MHVETFYGSSRVSALYAELIARDHFKRYKLKDYKLKEYTVSTILSGDLFETTITAEYIKL